MKHWDLMVDNIKIQHMSNFKYLRSTFSTNNSIEEKNEERIILKNKTYFAHLFLFRVKLLSSQTKLKLYWSTFRPITTYAGETGILIESFKQIISV